MPRKKKEEKKRQRYLLHGGEEKKNKIKATYEEAHVHMHMSIFVNQQKIYPHSVFSPFWWA